MDIRDIAPGVTRDAAGYWSAPGVADVAYPEEGHEFCASVEDASFWFAQRNRVIRELVRRYPPAGGPIFDVGAGNGYVAAMLEREGFPTVAIEPRPQGAANAARRGIRHVVRGMLPSEAFRHGSAGAIALFDVIEHVEADGEWLASLRPYLAPGGRLYLTTPAYQWLWSDVDASSGHYRRYTLGRLRRVLQQAGFLTEYATYAFWCLPPALFLVRLLTRGAERKKPGVRTAEHTIGGAWVRRAAQLVFGAEPRLVARGISIPFGATCVVVGRDARTV